MIATLEALPAGTAFVGFEDACRILRVSRATLYRHIENGLVPRPQKLGRRPMWRSDQLREWMAKLPSAA